MKIVLDGIIEGQKILADKSIKFNFVTQEIDSKHAGELYGLSGQYCKILISDSNITQDEESAVEETHMQGGKKKTRSGRLRSVMFVVWKNSDLKNKVEFETYYANEMERLINEYKEKIESES